MHRHNNDLRQLDRDFNSHYNSLFINKYQFLSNNEDPIMLHGEEGISKGFITYMTAWLSNIDRLMSMLIYSNLELNTASYDLIDLGGGKSISTIYLSHSYHFKSVTSVDIHPQLLEDGKRNLNAYNMLGGSNLNIDFICKDIQEYRLEEGKYIFFAFNPFEWSIFEKFTRNNLEVLKSGESILLYANDRCINQLLEFSTLIARDEYYNLSVLKF